MDNNGSRVVIRHTNVNRPRVVARPVSSLHSHAAQPGRINSTSTRSHPTSSHSDSSRDHLSTGEMERSPTPPQNPIPITHIHPEIHPADQPGVESFLPHTQEIYERLRDGAREGGPPHPEQIHEPGRRTFLSMIASSTYSQPRYSQLDPNPRPITPGNDDAAIRFALDQVSRDEDIRGTRQYPGDQRRSTEQHPADRQRLLGEGPTELAATPTTYNHYLAYADTPSTAQRYTDTPVTTSLAHRAPVLPPPVIASTNYGSPHGPPPETALPPTPDEMVPFDHEEPRLDFLPSILRPLWLGIFIFLVLLMNAGLLFSGIFSANHLGLYAYTSFGGSRWFVFKYLPTLLGMILLLWLFQVQIALQRIAPYMAMASHDASIRTEGPFMEVQPTNFFLPKTFYLRAKQPIIGVCMIIFWLQIFTIPLLACLYNVYFYGDIYSGNGSWRWTAVQGIVWTLFALYFLLLASLVLLAVWLWKRRTGLLWDPRSLAELIALLDRSNFGEAYEGSETFPDAKTFRERLRGRSDRLGYWSTVQKPNDIFYGIAEEGGHARQYSEPAGALNEKQNRFSVEPGHGYDSTTGTPRAVIDVEKDDDMYSLRTRYLPWMIKPSIALLWACAAILIYLAFLIVSFVHQAVLYGFNPLVPVLPDSAGFSSANFLYAFLPALLAQIVFLGWLSIDYAFRRLQPYASLSTSAATGSHAQDSLLLDYPSRLPFSCSLAALLAGHYKVAWFSLLSLIAATLPVLAGGVFWSQFYIPQQEVRVSVHPSGYYALCVFLALIVFSTPLILLGLHKRRLPHPVTTLAEQFSFLYASPLLGERGPDRGAGARHSHSNAKVEMSTRLLAAYTKNESQAEGGRFVLGRFIGRDGRPHLGIDRIGRGEKKKPWEEVQRERMPMTRRTWRQSQASPLATRFDSAGDVPNTTPYGETAPLTGGGSPNAFAQRQDDNNELSGSTTVSGSPIRTVNPAVANRGYGRMGKERAQENAMYHTLGFGGNGYGRASEEEEALMTRLEPTHSAVL